MGCGVDACHHFACIFLDRDGAGRRVLGRDQTPPTDDVFPGDDHLAFTVDGRAQDRLDRIGKACQVFRHAHLNHFCGALNRVRNASGAVRVTGEQIKVPRHDRCDHRGPKKIRDCPFDAATASVVPPGNGLAISPRTLRKLLARRATQILSMAILIPTRLEVVGVEGGVGA